MTIRVAINGYGRIGRCVLRSIFENQRQHDFDVVAINDLSGINTTAHLTRYDSTHGRFKSNVVVDNNKLVIDGHSIVITAERDPSALPWKELNIDLVFECTGRFTEYETAKQHITAGAKKVLISAPGKNADATIVYGVNHKNLQVSDCIVSNASCTTNSIAPVAQIMHELFGVKKAMMTTVHSVTAEQNIVDGLPPKMHPDMRRARAALVNIVPTSTGAAKAVTEVVPELKGKFDGLAIRVPTLDVSLSDFTFVLKRKVTAEEINDAFLKAAASPRYKGILGVSDVPLVSSDFIGSTFSSVVDLEMTRVVDGDLVKVLAWYDNEWGYSVRLVEMAEHVGSL